MNFDIFLTHTLGIHIGVEVHKNRLGIKIMRTHNRSKLIADLNETALGIIAETEITRSDDNHELIELAGALDKLRVSLLQKQNCHISTVRYFNVVPAKCA